MSTPAAVDWDPGTYLRFRGLRLRPALDLLNGVPALPAGDLVDLGCGTGVMGAALATRFPLRRMIGVDSSATMLAKAQTEGGYADLARADIANWEPDRRPALIYSNAALHWLPSHGALFPRLAGFLAPGGTLAVQMPRQQAEPSHRLLYEAADRLFPGRFGAESGKQQVWAPEDYLTLLSPLGELTLWETTYLQVLAPQADGHPVRAFTRSTAARPILEALTDGEAMQLLAAYDAALEKAYPTRPSGEAIFPFRRLFMTLTVPA